MSAILAAILDFLKKFIFRKTATNFTGISRKHVFLASNTKIIEDRVHKKNLQQIFPKFYKFLFWTLICIKNCCHGNNRFHNMSAILAAILDFSKFHFSQNCNKFYWS